MRVFEVVVEGEFSAAHALKLYDGSWEPRHGHDWKVAVTVRSATLDQMSVVVDFEMLKPELKRVLAEFHEKFINDHPDFSDGKLNTSTENIAMTIHKKLAERWKSPARIAKVTVWETPDAAASYEP